MTRMSEKAFEPPSGRISPIRPQSVGTVSGVVALAALVVLAIPTTAAARQKQTAANCAATTAEPTRATTAKAEKSILCLLNVERSKRGLHRLRSSPKLAKAARGHSKDMVKYRRFRHKIPGRPNLVKRIKKTGYLVGARAWSVGENIAWGTGSYSTPASLVDAWMHSAGHRRNILRRSFKHVGVGIVTGAPTRRNEDGAGATVTTDFGKRS